MALPAELLALGAGMAVIGIIVGLYQLLGRRVDLDERLGAYGRSAESGDAAKQATRENEGTVGERMDRVLVRRGFAEQTARDLSRADFRLTVSEFLLLHVVTAAIGFGLGWVFVGSPLGGIVIGAVAFYVPRIMLSFRIQGRQKAFNGQLADTLMLMSNSLRSGYSLLQAMEAVSREAPAPTSQEFGRVIREVALGLTPQQALTNLAERIQSEDLEMMVTAINVQHEVGGSLARVLDSIGVTIRERVRIHGEISALTAQQRLSGYIIAGLPFAVAAALYFMNRDYMMGLFSSKYVVCGPMYLAPIFATVMVGIGFVVIRKIVDIKV